MKPFQASPSNIHAEELEYRIMHALVLFLYADTAARHRATNNHTGMPLCRDRWVTSIYVLPPYANYQAKAGWLISIPPDRDVDINVHTK